VFNET
jgi:catalase